MTGRNRQEYIRKARRTHLQDQEDARIVADNEAGWHRLYQCCSLFWFMWTGLMLSLVWNSYAIAAPFVVGMAMYGGAWVIKSDFGRWPWELFRRR